MNFFIKYFILFLVWLRWRYFHAHPAYIPFYMGTEKHFQHRKTGSLYCNFRWKE